MLLKPVNGPISGHSNIMDNQFNMYKHPYDFVLTCGTVNFQLKALMGMHMCI
jgi:hypothetical protein